MRPIDPALVDEVWRETIAYPPGRVEAEAEVFLARQPHVAAFARSATEGRDDTVQKAALGLAFLLFKILERSLGQPFPTVTEARLREASDAMASRLGHVPEEVAVGRLRSAVDAEHPTLVSHMLSVFYGDDAGHSDYDGDVRASLLLLLRTLSDALDVGPVDA